MSALPLLRARRPLPRPRRSCALLATAICAAALLAGCATTVQFEALRAPELDLGAARTIRLGELKTGAYLPPPSQGLGDGIGGVETESAQRGRDPELQAWVVGNLAEAIRRNGTFRTTTGDDFDAVIDATYKYRAEDDVRGTTQGSGEPGKEIARTVTASIEFSVRDAQGLRLGTAVARGQAARTEIGRNSQEAALRLATGYRALFLAGISSAHENLVEKIAPHTSIETRLLETGGAAEIRRANKRAAKGAWDDAAVVWRRSLAGPPEHRAAALHNLAVHDEVRGELDSALVKYEEVRRLVPSDEHDEDWLRADQRVRERERRKAKREQMPLE